MSHLKICASSCFFFTQLATYSHISEDTNTQQTFPSNYYFFIFGGVGVLADFTRERTIMKQRIQQQNSENNFRQTIVFKCLLDKNCSGLNAT